MGINIGAISVFSEFQRCNVHYDYASNDEIRIRCPFHDDNSPSCYVNTEKREFVCHSASCNTKGSIVKLLCRIENKTQAEVLLDLAQRYALEDEKVIEFEVVERWHQEIWKADALRNELYKRGVTDEIIRYRRFGENEGRVTIPIPAESGVYVNVRKYLPGAPGELKMRNMKGYGKPRIYPVEQMRFDTLVLTGGECKAVVGADQLNRHNIGCVTLTAGETNVFEKNLDLLKKFTNKLIYVCMDIDEAGQKAAKSIAATLRNVAKFVAIVDLPLDRDKFPKGDINDFVACNGNLYEVICNTKEYKSSTIGKVELEETEPVHLPLAKAITADYVNKRVSVDVVISAMDTTPYLIPKDITIECTRDIACCPLCPVFTSEQNNFRLPNESPYLLEFIGSSSTGQLDTVKSIIGIPKQCRICDFQATTEYNVEDTRVSPQLTISDRTHGMQPVPAICLTTGLQLNENYVMTGRLAAHPKTQQATLIISKSESAKDALSQFKCDDLEQLGEFWPKEWSVESMEEKLNDIYDDFEYNITGVYSRKPIHLITDLTYHSPLYINFDGKIEKGWVESLIIGDSSHGKSTVVQKLQEHYQLGSKLECKNASVAGILGGLEKLGDRFFVSWGAMPNNDGRLIVFEEVKGCDPLILSKLTDMRSSGFAEISKIGRQWKTHARARSIWISNARNGLEIAQHTYGITAIKELMGALEDVRRFDIALIVANSEVDPAIINLPRSARKVVPHKFSGALCRNLILWAWTRLEHQVLFEPDARDYILKAATSLSEEFSDGIPLIDRGSMRYKLARLSAAVAGRLFSCDDSYQNLIVYPCHAEYIVKTLRQWYSSPTFGYVEFTNAQKLLTTLLDPSELRSAICKTPYPRDFCKALLARDFIEAQDLADWTMSEKGEVLNLISLFVRKHALVRKNRAYCKTSKFIEFLKQLADDPDLKNDIHPDNRSLGM